MEFGGAENFGFCGLLNWLLGCCEVFAVCEKLEGGWLEAVGVSIGWVGENILLDSS